MVQWLFKPRFARYAGRFAPGPKFLIVVHPVKKTGVISVKIGGMGAEEKWERSDRFSMRPAYILKLWN